MFLVVRDKRDGKIVNEFQKLEPKTKDGKAALRTILIANAVKAKGGSPTDFELIAVDSASFDEIELAANGAVRGAANAAEAQKRSRISLERAKRPQDLTDQQRIVRLEILAEAD